MSLLTFTRSDEYQILGTSLSGMYETTFGEKVYLAYRRAVPTNSWAIRESPMGRSFRIFEKNADIISKQAIVHIGGSLEKISFSFLFS